MRNKTVILLLLVTAVMAVADRNMFFSRPLFSGTGDDSVSVDTRRVLQDMDSADDTLKADTAVMDSLHKAIYMHNKAVDDSLYRDSVQKSKSNGIESPVQYSAEDSIVYDAETGIAHLYGSSNVDYQNMKLKSEKVYLNLDSSLVRATGVKDTTERFRSANNGDSLRGAPVFTLGNDEYKSDTMAFNFKSKKGLIKGVYTEQEEGFLRGEVAKRDSSGTIYMQHGRYTTCDKPHPDFYIALSRAKVRPGKDVVFGPAYLVVADVPLPLAIPYGFFPFTKKYSSGFIMPSYGDEQDRGFYLRDGGYYFAISDKWDLKLLGEIYTQGSWGVSVASNYRKRYKYSGSFLFSYQDTKTGDKGLPDYSEQESFKIQWSHRQDAKANPYSSLSASVNFATSSYERNNLNSMYNPQTLTQSTRTSSVNWSTQFSSIGLSLSTTANLSQNMRDSTIAVTLPDLNISISRFFPFKRKHAVGKPRWYENISMSYTGQMSNSISTKEDHILHANLIKEWRNGFQHRIPIQGNFTVFNYINLTPSFTFTDRMYTQKIRKEWDDVTQREVAADTTYGFHNIYNWALSVSASTKLYGFWVPNRKIFGDKLQAIRHVITPQVSVSYAPDFSARRYGYYDSYQYTDANGELHYVEYSPYQNGLYGVPGRGKSENISWDISNNIEAKIKSDKDSTGYKKISIIDELGFAMSYNAAADYHRWSDLSVRLRLKWWKNYTFSMNAGFSTYAYEIGNDGKPYVGNHTEWGYGRLPRFQGMSQNFSFTINPDKIKQWFGNKDDEEDEDYDDGEGVDTNIESNIDDDMERGKHRAKKKSGSMAQTDADGYMRFSMPWSVTIGYGITMRENTSGKFNTKRMRYPYKFSQTLNVSGNIRISDGWNITFASGYDFENHDMSMTTASLSRDLHCFNMSASIVLAPYTSYNFTFRCNASTLTDALKYDKRSGISNAVQWY